MDKTIYIWSDKREKSLHQVYIVKDYKVQFEKMGFRVYVNQTKDWGLIYKEIIDIRPNLFMLHGGKVFPAELCEKIYKKVPVYLRWRWHLDPPKDLIDNSTIASKVSFIKNNYDNKLFYSPHPAIITYFNVDFSFEYDIKYHSDVVFVGLADKRGKDFYTRSNRNYILQSKMIRYLNREMFGTGNIGFYDYEEKSKYYKYAKMILNVSSFNDEINFRVFNGMACKTALLSDETEAMKRFFSPGYHYIKYNKNDIKSFEGVVKYYLENKEAREKIALNGYNEIMMKHTSYHRLREVLKKLKMI